MVSNAASRPGTQIPERYGIPPIWENRVGTFGGPQYSYEVIDNWAKRPYQFTFHEVADVDVDRDDNVFVFSRGQHPIMVFDKDGRFLDSWGYGQFTCPHGITVAPDGTVWCVDSEDHSVKQFTAAGKLLQTIGSRFLNAPRNSGQPFNRPTHLSVASNGNMYVSDGYGNASVHVFDPGATYLRSWGEPGTGPGQFDCVHSVHVDSRDRVYVCDRYNRRVQIFDLDGKFITEWPEIYRPCDLVVGRNDVVYIAELDHRVSLWTLDGALLTRWGEEGESLDAGGFMGPHGLTVDSRGVIYVGDVAERMSGIDRGSRAVQKFVPIK